MSFNLTTEKWIAVVSKDWKQREVSLIELFETWEFLREIQAENPPTTLALYRFLLAILHQAYQGPKDVGHWEEIQSDNGRKAIEYLREKANCFDLLHPEKPFMQDISITENAAGEVYLASDFHGNNTSTVFCHEHQWNYSSLSIEEGARLVLRTHLFDVGGKKTGATDSAAVIPAMDSANVLISGKSLAETLLLNLMAYNPSQDRPSPIQGEDLPSWERPCAKPKHRIPSGYIDYLTYQWRRVRLFSEDGKIVRIAVHPGDRFPKDISATLWECGIAYRKTQKGVFPVKLNLQRSVWRDSTAFLQSAEESSCPRILKWRAELSTEDLVSDFLHLQILGLTVDNAKPLGWTSEQFSAPIQFLTDRELWQSLKTALAIAEDHQQVFRSFKGSPYHALAEALNNHEAGQLATSLDGESRYWGTLDRKFTEFLDALHRDSKADTDGITRYGATELSKWTATVQKAAEDAFTESIQSIRNYQARASALRSLNYQLGKLRAKGDTEKSGKAKNSGKTT